MKNMGEWFGGFRTFLGEVKVELKKCAWPTRPELMESTMVVIVSIVLVGIYVGLCDTLSMSFLNLIIR
jgi:preprotein translocase subunit SecE